MPGSTWGAAGFGACAEKYVPKSLISALVMLAAIGDICGSLRLPSRNITSCVVMNCFGCPASDGTAGVAEMPFGAGHAARTASGGSPPAPQSEHGGNPHP